MKNFRYLCIKCKSLIYEGFKKEVDLYCRACIAKDIQELLLLEGKKIVVDDQNKSILKLKEKKHKLNSSPGLDL